jgi:hypothetical protein
LRSRSLVAKNAALTELIAKYKNSDEFEVAKVYAFRNQPDEAFDWPGLRQTE